MTPGNDWGSASSTSSPSAASQARKVGASLREAAGLQMDGDARHGLELGAESWFEVAEVLAELRL